MTSAEPIQIVGHNGLLGQALCESLGPLCETVPGHPGNFDLTRPDDVNQAISQARAGLVINCAGYTAVDRAESEAELANSVNAKGAGLLARACSEHGKHLVHISTDYVFDGQKGSPYREDDPTSPISAYGQSKILGEIEVRKELSTALIVRSAWLFGHAAPGFVDTIIDKVRKDGEAKVVTDQTGCPTYTIDLARAVIDLSRKRVHGLLHVVNSGQANRYEFARNAVKLAGLDPDLVRPALTGNFSRGAARPMYSVLDTRRYARLTGGPLPSWLDGLKRYIGRQKEESA